jgi:hypothetical protein
LEYSYNDYNSQTKECYCTYEQTPVEDTSSLAVQNCEQKTPGSMRDYCYNDYAKTHLDEQYCKKVSSKNRAGCYKQLARLKGNPFICDKSWDDNECLKQFDPYAIGVQTNGGNVILTDRSYNNSVLTVSFMPKVELMLKDLLLSKDGQNIELTGVGLNNASRLGSGLGSAFTTSNYKNETYKFYPNNEYIIYLDAKSPINVEDIFVLSWGGQNTLNITLDLPAIESVSANYDNGIVNVNYHNSGGQGEVYLNEPTVKKANNDPVFCMEPIESLGIHSIGAGENLTINYYCDQYYTSAEIGDIEVCTYANQSPPEICKTYN